jgi:hypothetical protein
MTALADRAAQIVNDIDTFATAALADPAGWNAAHRCSNKVLFEVVATSRWPSVRALIEDLVAANRRGLDAIAALSVEIDELRLETLDLRAERDAKGAVTELTRRLVEAVAAKERAEAVCRAVAIHKRDASTVNWWRIDRTLDAWRAVTE